MQQTHALCLFIPLPRNVGETVCNRTGDAPSMLWLMTQRPPLRDSHSHDLGAIPLQDQS